MKCLGVLERVLLFLSTMIFALSCTESFLTEEDSLREKYLSTDTFRFGNLIEIPYSIDNLKRAYNTLDPQTKSEINIDNLTPTHYYARFTPLDGEDLDVLLNDENLILYEFPMDVEILEFGSSYHDPSLPEDQPTYQYSVVDVDYWENLVEKIDFESKILMSVYMPEDSDWYVETKSQIGSFAAYQKLLKAAYKMTGQDIIPETKASWTPSGYIKAYDNVLQGQTPIKSVRVRGKHLLKTVEALTDTNGYYVFPQSFKNTPTMMIVWESDEWDIREGTTGQAYLSKPCVFGQPWNVYVSATDGDGVFFAAIHRAAYRSFYGYTYNLLYPSYSRKMKIGYVDEIDEGTKPGAFHRSNALGAGLDIEIASHTLNYPYMTISQIFCSTCHELGHAIHYTSTYQSNYLNSETRILESWAVFVQYLFTRREYSELGVENNLVPQKYYHSGIQFEEADLKFNFQMRFHPQEPSDSVYFHNYTPVLIDLYDDYNQLVYYDYQDGDIHPDDVIHGFIPDVIRYYVFNSTSFSALKQTLIQFATSYPTNPYGITQENINKIFSVYENV